MRLRGLCGRFVLVQVFISGLLCLTMGMLHPAARHFDEELFTDTLWREVHEPLNGLSGPKRVGNHENI